MLTTSAEYKDLIASLTERIRTTQVDVARAVNRELVMLYWSIGREILDRQGEADWGDDVIGYIATDLAAVFAGQKRGLSRRNLFYMRRFAAMWPEPEKVQSVIARIGWTHHIQLLDAFADDREHYAWYAAKSAEGHWSVRHLKGQIDLKLHERAGAALTNFSETVEPTAHGAVVAAMKDP